MSASTATSSDLARYLDCQKAEIETLLANGEGEASQARAIAVEFAEVARQYGLDALAGEFDRLAAA